MEDEKEGCLDSPLGKHLLAEVVLVFTDGAIPAADGLVLADHDVLGDLVEETEVVGDDDDTTAKLVDGVTQAVDGGDIKTVGRFVEEDHVGSLDGKQSEHDTALLAFGKGAHQSSLRLTAETVAAELSTPVLVVLADVRELVTDEFKSRLGQVKLLGGVLTVHAELQVSVTTDTATDGVQLSGHETKESGFADTVGADERGSRVHVDTKVEVLVQGIFPLLGVRERHVVKGQDRRRKLLDLGEAEAEDSIGDDGLNETVGFHLVEDLLTGLGLSDQVGICTSRGNELLDVGNFLLLLVVGLHLVGLLLGAGLVVRIVVTTIVEELLHAHVDHIRADTVQEVHGVRDENKGTIPLLHVFFQPHTGLQVQVSSGIVQEQERRLDEERLSEGDTHTPATGHVLGLLVNGVLVETKTS